MSIGFHGTYKNNSIPYFWTNIAKPKEKVKKLSSYKNNFHSSESLTYFIGLETNFIYRRRNKEDTWLVKSYHIGTEYTSDSVKAYKYSKANSINNE